MLLRVQPAIGERERRRRIPGLGGDEHGTEAGRDVEPVTLLREFRAGGVEKPAGAFLPWRGEHTELVAAEPVRLAMEGLDCVRELAGEPAK